MAKDDPTFQKSAVSIADILDLAKFGGVFAERRENALKPVIEVGGETYSKEFLRQVIPFLQHASSQALGELAAKVRFPSQETKRLYAEIGYSESDSAWDKQINNLAAGHILHGDQGCVFDADAFLQKLEPGDIQTMRKNHSERIGYEAFIAGYSNKTL